VGTLRPLKDAKPVELKFRATMSAEFVEKMIDESGMEPSEEWEFAFDLGEIESPELRRRLRQAHDRYMDVEPYPVLPRTEEDPEKFLELLEPWLDRVEAEEAEERESLAAFAENMKSWVTSHGSNRLQLAVERDYRANTSYAVERAGQELPGFWVDTAEDCEWGERVDPTEELLVLEKSVRNHLQDVDPRLDVRIVWLTETPRALDRKMEALNAEFEPQEALIVPDYLGRYLLVMPSGEDLQRDPAGEF
jgi:hypothetical protein